MSQPRVKRVLRRAGDRLERLRAPPKIEAAALIAMLLVVSTAVLWEGRQNALQRAQATATNLVALLHEQTTTALHTTDLALRSAKRYLEREAPQQNDPAFRAELVGMREDIAHIRALFVIGPDGFIVHDTDYPDTPRISLADRTYFKVHQEHADDEVFVGEPLVSRSLFRPFVPLSRRIGNSDGSFAGVAVAAIDPTFFEHTYRRLQMHDLDSVALFHADSTLIARIPPLPEMHGRNLSRLNLFTAALPQDQDSGVFEIENVFTGRSSIIAYRKLDDFPLIVTVALDRAEALSGWRLIVWVNTLATFLLGALILLLYSLMARRRLERQMARQQTLAAEKLEAIGMMTSGVAHDFNNVLAAIAAGVSLIRRRGPEKSLVSGIDAAVERGNALAHSLLRFAKDQDLEMRLCHPNERIGELEVLIRQSLPPNVRLQLELSQDVDYIRVSPAAFDAAVINLTVNAAHAMPGGGALRVAACKRSLTGGELAAGSYVSVRVTDTGCGIPPAALAQIFDPFFTTKGRNGTGLGLFQVRNFARAAGGDVRVTSETGVGTEVEILIPAAAPPGEPEMQVPPQRDGGQRVSGGPARASRPPLDPVTGPQG